MAWSRHRCFGAVAALALGLSVSLATAQAPVPDDPELVLAVLAADPIAGAAVAERCLACHSLGRGEPDGTGPNLYGVVGAAIGRADGYAYSQAFAALNRDGAIWSLSRLNGFLESPFAAIPGTRMGFGGVPNPEDRLNLIAYLRTLADAPMPLVPVAAEGPDGTLLAALTFDADQVANGRLWYRRANCIACHGETLRGVVDTRENGDGDGPPLRGARFVEQWFGGPVAGLYRIILETMPPDDAGTLAPDTVAALLAFILERNGFRAGDAALPADDGALEEMGYYQ